MNHHHHYRSRLVLVVFLLVGGGTPTTFGFVHKRPRSPRGIHRFTTGKPPSRRDDVNRKQSSNKSHDNDDGTGSSPSNGQQDILGEISKSMIGTFANSYGSLNHRDDYDTSDDLSMMIDRRRAKRTNTRPKNTLRDATNEIVRRIMAGEEYTQEDLILLLKLVLTVGVSFQPIARMLPIRTLVQMLDLSVSQRLADRVKFLLANELDTRVKDMVAENMQRHFARQAIRAFTGKEEYVFGDIARSLLRNDSGNREFTMDEQGKRELKQWDDGRRGVSIRPLVDRKIKSSSSSPSSSSSSESKKKLSFAAV